MDSVTMYMSTGAGCPGYLPVPTPVYWSPYLAALTPRRPSFNIADILPAGLGPHQATPAHTAAALLSPSGPALDKVYTDRRLHLKSELRKTESKELQRVTNEHMSKMDLYRSLHRSRRHDTTRRACSEDKCSLVSALGPLQALCTEGVQQYAASTLGQRHVPPPGTASPPTQLAFGINQILSDDFGKQTSNKENMTASSMTPDPDRCPCECTTINSSVFPAGLYFPAHALSAVETIQPPMYPASPPGTDILPGPYSIMNSDVNVGSHQKRKRSWSRAVFSNLQRKGLEKRFDVQKYVTKPDRRQLAAMLGLTDAQVKVWFQNRRMKWRHAQQTSTEIEKHSASDAEDMAADVAREFEQRDRADGEEEHGNSTEYSTAITEYPNTNIETDDISDDCYMESSLTESNDSALILDDRDIP